MLVYGDARFTARLSVLIGWLKQRLARLAPGDLDGWRVFLIQCGQLEQAGADFWDAQGTEAKTVAPVLQHITDLAAGAFYECWRGATGAAGSEHLGNSQGAALRGALAQLDRCADALLTVKVPEGFEFYALYPEQYCAAARQWALAQSAVFPGPVLVAGIRSIGTTLSAAVAATLRAAGWQVARVTVRPAGPPYDRIVDLAGFRPAPDAWALLVDEGPGLSGSSMAALGEALSSRGIAPERLVIFPGHAGDPGPAASAKVRQWWASTARRIIPMEDLRWRGLSLTRSLAARSVELSRGSAPATMENLGSGQWREVAYRNSSEWPAVASTFERLKYRCIVPGKPALLWKFAGLGAVLEHGQTAAEQQFARLTELGQQGWTPPPLQSYHGFLCFPWIDGARLTPRDALEAPVLDRIGQYLAIVSNQAFPPDQRESSVIRLAEMAFANIHEAIGENAASLVWPWAEPALQAGSGPSCGDGHMAPYEWVRQPAGEILKADAGGHEVDHTLIGRQSWIWDFAGTIVEWGLDGFATARLSHRLKRHGLHVSPGVLEFYSLAYNAFRMGQCTLCADMSTACDEDKQRLRAVAARQRQQIIEYLTCPRSHR